MLAATARGVHCRERPRDAVSWGTRAWSSRVRWPFADQRPRETEPPAQLRTSWAKRLGSGLSWREGALSVSYLSNGGSLWKSQSTYDGPAVNTNDEVKPRLDVEFEVRVAEHLETEGALVVLLSWLLPVQAGHEAVQRIEHGDALVARNELFF